MTNIPTKLRHHFGFNQRQQQRRGSFPRAAWECSQGALRRESWSMRRNVGHLNVGRSASHTAFPRSAWERELSKMLDKADVGRNKAIQARSARWRFRRVREVFAGNASSRCRSDRLIPAYFEMWLMRRNAGHLNIGRSASHIAFPRGAWECELSKMLDKAENHD